MSRPTLPPHPQSTGHFLAAALHRVVASLDQDDPANINTIELLNAILQQFGHLAPVDGDGDADDQAGAVANDLAAQGMVMQPTNISELQHGARSVQHFKGIMSEPLWRTGTQCKSGCGSGRVGRGWDSGISTGFDKGALGYGVVGAAAGAGNTGMEWVFELPLQRHGILCM